VATSRTDNTRVKKVIIRKVPMTKRKMGEGKLRAVRSEVSANRAVTES
jgi:hypothetical protein